MPTKKGEEKKRPRRPDGEGSITRRADGRYQGSFYNARGKRCYVYHVKRNECAALLREAIAKDQRGDLERVNKSVGTWLVEWLDGTKKMNYRANSYQQRYYVIHHRLLKVFEDIPLAGLDAEQIEGWVASMIEEGLAASTIHSYHGVLDASLANAVKKRLIRWNPCDAIELPSIEKKDAPTLTLEEAHRLLAVINGHWLEPIVVVLLGTGMRLGELLSLKWVDVDLVDKVIFVCRNIAHISQGPTLGFVEGPPKTESSRRYIALASFVVDALKAHRIAQVEQQLAASIWTDNDLVFPNECGGYRFEKTVERNLRSAMIKAGLNPEITPHKLRHSTGSILYAMGVDPKVIQDILGHATIGQTMDTYVHLKSTAQLDAMTQLNSAFERGKEKQSN